MADDKPTGGETSPADDKNKKPDTTGGKPPEGGGESEPTGEKTPPAKTYTQADLDRELRKKERDLEKKIEQAEARAKLSEDERLKSENDSLKTALRDRDARDAIAAALASAEAKSPSLLIASVRDQFKFDAEGKLTNAGDLVAELKSEFPEQFGKSAPAPPPGIGGNEGNQQGGAKLTREALEKMTTAEIGKLPWDDVKTAMAGK